MKLWRHDFGTSIALAIEDESRQDIEYQYFSFYNHGATSGELHWLTEHMAYFWTSPEDLKHSLIEAHLFKLLNIDAGRYTKGKKGGLMPQAIERAIAQLNEIPFQAFLSSSRGNGNKPYSMGYLEYYSPDLNFL